MFGTTGCGTDPVTKPTTSDSADTIVTRTVFNQMKVGLVLYDLNLSDEESFAVYNATSNTTLLIQYVQHNTSNKICLTPYVV